MQSKVKQFISVSLQSILHGKDGTEWLVRPKDFDGGEYSAAFRTKTQAREYKKLLRLSDRAIDAEIIKRQWTEGFITGNEVVR